MLDRLAPRLLLWTMLTILPAAAAAATLTNVVRSEFASPLPLLWTVTLLAAITGWRLLNRELRARQHDGDALREQARRLHEAMHASVDGLYLLRAIRDEQGRLTDLEFTDVNGTGATLLRRPRGELVGRRLREDIGGPLGQLLFDRYQWALSTGSPIVEELRVDPRAIGASWILHQAMPTSDGLAVTARDISARKREERSLRRASLSDDLTGLYNRRGFMALADQQLRMARRNGKDSVVLYADMDGFKQLNDTFGHAVGDRALQLVARILRHTVRESDVVARFGGDEFTILAADADGVGARVIQRRIEERLLLLNASGEFPATLHLTIGYTRVRPSDHAGISELLARADQLLYSRKRRRHLARVHGGEAVESATSTRRPRRTPRVAPIAVPADVAAVAMAAARQLPRMNTASLPSSRPAAVPAHPPTFQLSVNN
jgi:diguanylate cyclase (GGDEF)-like protein